MFLSVSRFFPARRRAGHLAFLLALAWLVPPLPVQAQSKSETVSVQARSEPLSVVTSFSILADMAQQVGGDQVKVVSIIGPQSDAHNFEPRPQDVKTLAKADLFIVNGLAFETWAAKLNQSARFEGVQVVASEGARLLTFDGKPVGAAVREGDAGRDGASDHAHDHTPSESGGQAHDHAGHATHGDHDKHDAEDDHKDHDDQEHQHAAGEIDPHAWQDLRNAAVYVKNIEEAFVKADPANAALYRDRARQYTGQILELDQKIRQAFQSLPPTRRKLVTAHNAFGYFANAYEVQFIPVSGLAGQAETSAQRFAELVNTIRKEQIAGIFTEQGSSARLVEQIARETKVNVGKPLFSDALAAKGQPCDTYLGMMQCNLDQMLAVLKN